MMKKMKMKKIAGRVISLILSFALVAGDATLVNAATVEPLEEEAAVIDIQEESSDTASDDAETDNVEEIKNRDQADGDAKTPVTDASTGSEEEEVNGGSTLVMDASDLYAPAKAYDPVKADAKVFPDVLRESSVFLLKYVKGGVFDMTNDFYITAATNQKSDDDFSSSYVVKRDEVGWAQTELACDLSGSNYVKEQIKNDKQLTVHYTATYKSDFHKRPFHHQEKLLSIPRSSWNNGWWYAHEGEGSFTFDHPNNLSGTKLGLTLKNGVGAIANSSTNCLDGHDTISNHLMYMTDSKKPYVTRMYLCSGDNTEALSSDRGVQGGRNILLALEFNEDIRLASGNAADMSNIKLRLELNDKWTDRTPTTDLYAPLTSIKGRRMYFSVTTPEYFEDKLVDVQVLGFSDDQDWIHPSKDIKLVLFDKNGNKINDDSIKCTSLITDVAGNSIDWEKSKTAKKMVNPFAIDSVSPRIKEVQLYGEFLDSQQAQSTGYIRIGDEVGFRVVFDEQLLLRNGSDGPGWNVKYVGLQLNVRDKDGNNIVLKGREVAEVSAKTLYGASASSMLLSVVDFEPFVVDAENIPVGGIRAEKVVPLVNFLLEDLAANRMGNYYISGGTDKLVKVDNTYPQVNVVDITKDDEGYYYDQSTQDKKYFTIPIKITDTLSGVKGKNARAYIQLSGLERWVPIYYYTSLSSVNDSEQRKGYGFSNGTYYLADLPMTGGVNYLHFEITDGADYAYHGGKAVFKASVKIVAEDRAGNETEQIIKIKHNGDSVKPRIYSRSEGQNSAGNKLFWKGTVTDNYMVDTVKYQWGNDEIEETQVGADGKLTLEKEMPEGAKGSEDLVIWAYDKNSNMEERSFSIDYDFGDRTADYEFEGGSLTEPVLYPSLSVNPIGKVGDRTYHTFVIVPCGDGEVYLTEEGGEISNTSNMNKNAKWYKAAGTVSANTGLCVSGAGAVEFGEVKDYFDNCHRAQDITLLTIYKEEADETEDNTSPSTLNITEAYEGYKSVESMTAYLMGSFTPDAIIGEPLTLKEVTDESDPEADPVYEQVDDLFSENGTKWSAGMTAAVRISDYVFPVNISLSEGGEEAYEYYGGDLFMDDSVICLQKYDGSDWTDVSTIDVISPGLKNTCFTDDYERGWYRVRSSVKLLHGNAVNKETAPFYLEGGESRLDAYLSDYTRDYLLQYGIGASNIVITGAHYEGDKDDEINSGTGVLYVGDSVAEKKDEAIRDESNVLTFDVSMRSETIAGVEDDVYFRAYYEGDETAPFRKVEGEGEIKYNLKVLLPDEEGNIPFDANHGDNGEILPIPEGYSTIIVETKNNAGVITTLRTIQLKAYVSTPVFTTDVKYNMYPDDDMRVMSADFIPYVDPADLMNTVKYSGFNGEEWNDFDPFDEDTDGLPAVEGVAATERARGYYCIMDAYGNLGVSQYIAPDFDVIGPDTINALPYKGSSVYYETYNAEAQANPMGFHMCIQCADDENNGVGQHPDATSVFLTFDKDYSQLLKENDDSIELDENGCFTMRIPVGKKEKEEEHKNAGGEVDGTTTEYESWYNYGLGSYGIYHTEASESNWGYPGYAEVEIWGQFMYDKNLPEGADVTRTLTFTCADKNGNMNVCAPKVIQRNIQNLKPSVTQGLCNYRDGYGVATDKSYTGYVPFYEYGQLYGTACLYDSYGSVAGAYVVSDIEGCGDNGIRYAKRIFDGSISDYQNGDTTPSYTYFSDIHKDGNYKLKVTDLFGQTFDCDFNVTAFSQEDIAFELGSYDDENDLVSLTATSLMEDALIDSVTAVNDLGQTVLKEENIGEKSYTCEFDQNVTVTATLDDLVGTSRSIVISNVNGIYVQYTREDGEDLNSIYGTDDCPSPIRATIKSADGQPLTITNGEDYHIYDYGSRKDDGYIFRYRTEGGIRGYIRANCPYNVVKPEEKPDDPDVPTPEVVKPEATITVVGKRSEIYRQLGDKLTLNSDTQSDLASIINKNKAQEYIFALTRGTDVKSFVLGRNDENPAYDSQKSISVNNVSQNKAGTRTQVKKDGVSFDLYFIDKEDNERRVQINIPEGSVDTDPPSAICIVGAKASDSEGYYKEAIFLPASDEEIFFENVAVKKMSEAYEYQGVTYHNACSVKLRRNGTATYYFSDAAGNRAGVKVTVEGLVNPGMKPVDTALMDDIRWYGTTGNKEPLESEQVNRDVSAVLLLNGIVDKCALEWFDGDKYLAYTDKETCEMEVKGNQVTVTWHKNLDIQPRVRVNVAGSESEIMAELPSINIIDKSGPVVSNTSKVLAENKKSVTVSFETDKPAMIRESVVRDKAGHAVYSTDHSIKLGANAPAVLNVVDKIGNVTQVDTAEWSEGMDTMELNLQFSTDGQAWVNKTKELGQISANSIFYIRPDKAALISVSGSVQTMDCDAGEILEASAGSDAFCLVEATDKNTKETKHYTVAVLTPDTLPPLIKFKRRIVIVTDEASMDNVRQLLIEDATVTDDRDGDIPSENIVLGGVPETAKIGVYTISYEVADSAGNKNIQRSTLQIIDHNGLLADVDGLITAPGMVFNTDGEKHAIGIKNPDPGDLVVRIGDGILTVAQMKYEKRIEDPANVTLPEVGFYTVLVRTQERQQILLYLYREK